MLNENYTFSLQNAAAQTGAHYRTICHFLRRELKLFPYKLQMHQQISASDKLNRISFARYFPNGLRNDSKYLKRIVFSDDCKFSLSEILKKQYRGVWGSERPQE